MNFHIATFALQPADLIYINEGHSTSIPGKQFSGYQILAWYYVSWSLAMPDIVGQLGLNYKKEYEMAKTIAEKK